MRSMGFVPAVLLVFLGAVPAADTKNKAAEPFAAALEKASAFELLSLDPNEEMEKGGFHGYKILGQTTVKDEATRKSVAAAFRKAVEEPNLAPARCFIPRHGIRMKQGDKTVDLVICFQCAQVRSYTGDKEGGFLIGASAQSTFNKVLKDANVKLP